MNKRDILERRHEKRYVSIFSYLVVTGFFYVRVKTVPNYLFNSGKYVTKPSVSYTWTGYFMNSVLGVFRVGTLSPLTSGTREWFLCKVGQEQNWWTWNLLFSPIKWSSEFWHYNASKSQHGVNRLIAHGHYFKQTRFTSCDTWSPFLEIYKSKLKFMSKTNPDVVESVNNRLGFNQHGEPL